MKSELQNSRKIFIAKINQYTVSTEKSIYGQKADVDYKNPSHYCGCQFYDFNYGRKSNLLKSANYSLQILDYQHQRVHI